MNIYYIILNLNDITTTSEEEEMDHGQIGYPPEKSTSARLSLVIVLCPITFCRALNLAQWGTGRILYVR